MSFRIDKNVPLTDAFRKGIGFHSPARIACEGMEVNDSFEFPKALYGRVIGAAKLCGKKNGREFTIRRVSETSSRIWRIK